MNQLQLKIFMCGGLATNCYLVYEQATGQGILIDAPPGLDEVRAFITQEKVSVCAVLLTHVHFDHIGGLREVDFPFYLQEEDVPFLKDPQLNGSILFGEPVIVQRSGQNYGGEGVFTIASFQVTVFHTPGHTPGSVSLQIGEWLFSGDTLFFDSVGRTDIPYASHETIIESIKSKLLPLPEEVVVYPGHGPSTTIGREKKLNPFLAATPL